MNISFSITTIYKLNFLIKFDGYNLPLQRSSLPNFMNFFLSIYPKNEWSCKNYCKCVIKISLFRLSAEDRISLRAVSLDKRLVKNYKL